MWNDGIYVKMGPMTLFISTAHVVLIHLINIYWQKSTPKTEGLSANSWWAHNQNLV